MARRKFPFLPVMAGLFLVLAAYVIFVEIPRDQQESNPPAVLLLPGFNGSEVTRIEYAGQGGYTIEKETNGAWAITSPRRYRAEQSAIWPLLDDLASLEAVQTLKNMSPRLEQYGLNPPQGALIIKAGDKAWHLSFGAESSAQLERDASAQNYLVVDGAPPVHLVESFKLNRLRKPLADYRYRRILDLDIHGLAALGLNYKGALLNLVRDEGIWYLEERGGRKPVDSQKLFSLLSEIYEFTADDFVSDYAPAAQYGIYPGSSSIRIADGNGTRTLSFGRIEEGKVYCALEPYGEIWSVLEDKFNRLDKKPEDFLPEASTNTEALDAAPQAPLP